MEKLSLLSAEVGQLLREKGLSISCAESLSGGMLASSIVDTPGASDYFLGSLVSYAISAKEQVLHVEPELLAEKGPVSPEVASAMAEAARELFSSDLALSLTGLAGPLGDGSAAEVGEVYVGLATSSGTEVAKHLFGENMERQEIRMRSVEAAFLLLKTYLRDL